MDNAELSPSLLDFTRSYSLILCPEYAATPHWQTRRQPLDRGQPPHPHNAQLTWPFLVPFFLSRYLSSFAFSRSFAFASGTLTCSFTLPPRSSVIKPKSFASSLDCHNSLVAVKYGRWFKLWPTAPASKDAREAIEHFNARQKILSLLLSCDLTK